MKTPRGLQPPRGSSSPFPIFNSHSPRPQHYLHTSGTNIHPPRPSSASPSSPASSRLNPLSPPFDLRLPPRAMALSADNPGRPFGNSSARSSILNSPSSGGGGDSSLVATGSSIAPSLNSRNDDASPLPGASPSIGISARSASNQSHASEGSQDGGVDELNSDNDRDDKFNDVDNRHGKSDLIDCRVRIDESGRQSSAGDNKNQDHVGGDPPLSALGTAEHFPDADEPKPTEDKESISKPREALPAPLLKLPLGGGTEAIAKKSFTLNANAAPFSIGCSEAIGGGRGSSTWRSTGSVSPAASPLSPRIADGVPFIPPPLAHHFGGHHHLQQQFGPHGNGLQQHPHLLSPTTKGGRMRQVGSGNALPPFQKNAYGGALLYGEGAGVFPLYQPHHHPNHFHHPAHHPHFPLHTHRQYHQPHGSTNHLHHFLPLDVGHGLDHLVTPRRAPPASRFTTSFNRAGGGSSAPTTTAGDDQRESSSPADPRADADAVEDHKLAAAAGRGEDSSNSATSTSATFSEVEDKIQNQPPGNGFSSSTSPVAAATTSSSLKPPSAAEASAAAENHVAGSRPQLPLLPSLPLQTNSLHLMHHHHQHMHHQYHNHHRHQHQFHYHPQHHVSLLSPRNPQAGEATVHHHPQFPRTPRVGGAALSGRLPSSPSAAGGHSTTEEIYSPYNVHSAHQLIAPPSYHQASSAPHRRMAYPPHNAGGGEYSFFFQPQHHHDGFSGAPSATHRSHAPRGGPADERRDPAADLMAQPVIAVDLEGVRLHRNGQLCLLQLAIADDVYSAYVVDVHVLGEKAFRMKSRTGLTLKKLLEDPGILKVWFDPRNDSDALYHQFSITPNGIFDVQLAEVALRRSKVLNVQYVKGLPKLLRMSSFIPPAHKVLAEKLDHRAKLLYEPLLGGCYERFRKRPIDPLLLMYAAHDVHYSIPLALILAHELGSRWVAAVLRESQLRGEWWQKTEYESPSSQAPPFFA